MNLFRFPTLFLTLVGAVSSAVPLWAQRIQPPSVEGAYSFAIIADVETADRCRRSLDDYKRTLESEGLPVYLVSGSWRSPEEVRDLLRRLHRDHGLEGCVFVGDIPVAMIQRAQHLTSAFKMDEHRYDVHEASVPSDRFYDDFDLAFTPQGTPPSGLFHYYELSPSSPQYISCDIYSGRIRAQAGLGDPYGQIDRYLAKAVAAHRSATRLDRFVSYTGHGSYSNSLVAWRDEQQLLDEQFGATFRRTQGAKFLRYSMQPFMKQTVIRELRRDDLDLMVFHEHGMPDRQYLSGTPYVSTGEEAASELGILLREQARRPGSGRDRALARAAAMGLDPAWYCDATDPALMRHDSLADLRTGIVVGEVAQIAPDARFVLFDACYNGDFREPDFIAGHYIMSPGRCVATLANSVNVLQDKSSFDLLGLLGEGFRLGSWARNIHNLESHLFGDPTFRFASPRPSREVEELSHRVDTLFWSARLGDRHPDVQNLAMIRLREADAPGLADRLLGLLEHSPYAVVRYNAFRLLESYGGSHFREALRLAAYDRFEFLRRVAVTRMGRVGDEAFIPLLVDVYVRDRNAARIVFNISQSILCFDKDRVKAAVEAYFAGRRFFRAPEMRDELLRMVEDEEGRSPGEESLADMLDPAVRPDWRLARIAFLKNRPYHQHIAPLLGLLRDETQPEEVRQRLAEALAWFDLSVHRDAIARTGRELLAGGRGSEGFRKELQRMVHRLETRK